jgi:excisionase family DNA binding protein
MNSIILQGINTDDLKKIFREVLEEKLKKESEPNDNSKKINYLNRFEVAEILKISLPTLNNWSKSGIVQSYRIGNRILYKAEEIDQAIKAVKNLKYKRG